MIVEDDGVLFRSDPQAFSLGGTYNIKPDFLARAMKMHAPEVVEIVHRFSGVVDAVTGGALGRDAAKLVKKFIAADDSEWCNLSGASIRVIDQMEFGGASADPADVSSGATSSTYIFELRQTFTPPKSKRPRDFAIPVINFLEGTMQVQFCDLLPTGWGAGSGAIGGVALTYQMFARVVEGRKNELKSRRKLTEVSYNRDDTTYPIDGFVRGLYLSSVLTTTGYTSLAAITTLNSDNLELPPDLPTSLTRNKYRRESGYIDTTNDEFIRSTPTAIALVAPEREQKIGSMPQLNSVHVRIGSTPTSAVLIMDRLVKRPVLLSAKQVGKDPSDYQIAFMREGRVVDEKNTPTGEYAKDLAAVLPVRIAGGNIRQGGIR